MALQVKLRSRERQLLLEQTRGSTPARVVKRARILLCLDEGNSVDETAYRVGCGTATVKRIRRRFLDEGAESALVNRPSGAPPRALSDEETKELIAFACSSPPSGYARWSIRLLVEHFRIPVTRYTVHKVLKEDGLKPWREKNVVRSRH
jgi:putative transposase